MPVNAVPIELTQYFEEIINVVSRGLLGVLVHFLFLLAILFVETIACCGARRRWGAGGHRRVFVCCWRWTWRDGRKVVRF